MLKKTDWLRLIGGYGLFAAAVGYAVCTMPLDFWRLQLAWLMIAAAMLIAMIGMQMLQVRVFLQAHDIYTEWDWIALFAIKRGLLNAILPARGGTFIMMRAMTTHYPVKWQDYLLYNFVFAVLALMWSVVALIWLVFGGMGTVLSAVVMILILSVGFKRIPYREKLATMTAIAAGLYVAILLIFWAVLKGTGSNVELRDAMYFSVALNALAQISITPGNLGVREWAMGVLAPYMALPISMGILAGGIFHVMRIIVLGLLLMAALVKADLTRKWL